MIPKLSSSKIRKRCFFNEETGTIQKIWRNLQAWIMSKNASAVLSISHQKNKTKKFVKMEVANTFYATKKIKCSYNICEDKRISAISTLDIVINSDNNHHSSPTHTHTHAYATSPMVLLTHTNIGDLRFSHMEQHLRNQPISCPEEADCLPTPSTD